MRKSLACLMGAVLLVCLAPAAHASYPGLNGKIAFYSHPGSTQEIFVMNPDGSGITPITAGPEFEANPAWSPDGTKIAFDLNGDVHVMNADGSGVVNLTSGSFGSDHSPTWSSDGTKIAFVSSRSGTLGIKIYVMNADGSDVTPLTTDTTTTDGEPAWSPDGLRIAFVREERIYTVKTDGSNVTPVTTIGTRAHHPNWSPSGSRIAYTRFTSDPGTTGIHTIEPDGSNDADLSSFLTEATQPAWSPDGTKIVARRALHLWTMNPNGSGATQITSATGTYGDPDWQPLPFPGYPRPKGATPLRVPLVPAFAACTSPNRTHGPPLGFASCNPPAQTSPNLTVGTPDANGAAANSTGFFRISAHAGAPGPPDDSGAPINFSLTDVRCNASLPTCGAANAAGGADYLGELEVEFVVRMTDKFNGTGGPTYAEPGTVEDFTLRFSTSACAGTASTAEGSSCTFNTDILFLIPGAIKDTKRQIWAMDQVHVLDGGPDGDADTPGNSVFAVPGLFVP